MQGNNKTAGKESSRSDKSKLSLVRWNLSPILYITAYAKSQKNRTIGLIFRIPIHEVCVTNRGKLRRRNPHKYCILCRVETQRTHPP